MKNFTFASLVAVALSLSMFAQAADTNYSSGIQTVGVSIAVQESISIISITGGPFVIQQGVGQSNQVSVNYSWNLIAGNHTGSGGNGVQTASWFSSSTAALTGPANVPSALMTETRNGNALACSASNPQQIAGAGCHYTIVVPAGSTGLTGPVSGTGTDIYTLAYTGSGILAAGNYSGTWNVVVWAN